MYESIKSLRPHFHSLREVNGFASLDVKLPLHWSYEEIAKPYTSIQIKIQDKNDKRTLLSIISEANESGYQVILACANEIIKINKEEEEKQKLFQEKIKELQELFKKESLDKLKYLNITKEYGQKDSTSEDLVDEGDGERQLGDTESQDSND